MKVGDIVKNQDGIEFEIIYINPELTYSIKTVKLSNNEEYSFTMDGKYYEGKTSYYDLVLPPVCDEEPTVCDEEPQYAMKNPQYAMKNPGLFL